MHAALSQVLTTLEQSDARLRRAIEGVPAELRDQPPGSDRWSVAAVLEHLALVDERVTKTIAGKIDEARTAHAGPEEDSPTLLPTNVESMLIDRTAKRPAPDGLHPTGLTYQAALGRFESARAALRSLLASADGLALAWFIHEHPRFGALNPYQWAGFLAAHESRHAEQIAEIAAAAAGHHDEPPLAVNPSGELREAFSGIDIYLFDQTSPRPV